MSWPGLHLGAPTIPLGDDHFATPSRSTLRDSSVPVQTLSRSAQVMPTWTGLLVMNQLANRCPQWVSDV
jgi:hypothetical protein